MKTIFLKPKIYIKQRIHTFYAIAKKISLIIICTELCKFIKCMHEFDYNLYKNFHLFYASVVFFKKR